MVRFFVFWYLNGFHGEGDEKPHNIEVEEQFQGGIGSILIKYIHRGFLRIALKVSMAQRSVMNNLGQTEQDLQSQQEYPQTPPQLQESHDRHKVVGTSIPEYVGDRSAHGAVRNFGQEAMKENGAQNESLSSDGVAQIGSSLSSCSLSMGTPFSLSKLNAQAPEFIPRGPLSPLQGPQTPTQNQPSITQAQPVPRLMIPHSSRPPVYSQSPKMPIQFSAMSPFGVPRSPALAHVSAQHSPAVGVAEYNNEHDGNDADHSWSATPNSMTKGGVLSEDLRQKIVRQVEFYFSDANLSMNDYLMKFVSKDLEGYVPIPVVASFKKVRSLTTNYALVTAALRTSTQLVVSEDGKRVKRVSPVSNEEIEELQSRTVVAENLPEDCNSENIEKIFATVGIVKTVRICHPQAAEASSPLASRFPKIDMLVSNKLHALVVYETVEQAEKAVAELNDERNWRSGLRVRLLLRRMGKPVHQPRGRKAGSDNVDVNGVEEDVSIPEAVNYKQLEDNLQQSEHAEPMGEELHSIDQDGTKKGRGRGRVRGRGRGQYHNGRYPVGLTLSFNSIATEAQGKHPPGPRTPDGTRGFTMGRGKPLAKATV